MRTEYGIPVPRGVQKNWDASSMVREGAGTVLRKYHTPAEWGDPANCVAWFDRFERLRVIVGHYPNSRAATVRIDANGKWSATFGLAASADTHPKDGDVKQAPLVSGAVPSEASADAQGQSRSVR